MAKSVAVNAKGYRIGVDHQRAKLTVEEIELILELRDAGLSFRAIAAKWDDGKTIGVTTVRDVCVGNTHAQLADRYKVLRG